MDNIVQAVEDKQGLVTDDISDLATIAHMAVLRIAAGDTVMDSAASTTLDIMGILPRGFQPRCPMSSQVHVAPIPERFQDFLEEAIDKKTGSKDLFDAAGLLSQDFLQYKTDTSKEVVDRAWVRKKAFRGSNFEDAECDVVLKLGKLLGSYVPKRRNAIDGVKTRAAIAHVAL
ncbi:hypothetical protein BGZ72_001561, partial [Mortierella alpina]